MPRRMERTSDPSRLACHLQSSIQEIAEYAARVGESSDPQKQRRVLDAVYYQLRNAAAQVDEHRAAIDDAQRFGEVPEWDVAAEMERETS